MIECAICGKEVKLPRKKYCSKDCAAEARREYFQDYYHGKYRTKHLEKENDKREKEKKRRQKAFGAAVDEMADAIERGSVSLDDVRFKMGTFDKIPEIDFIPNVGSFVGTISDWELDQRIFRLKQKVNGMPISKANKAEKLKYIEEVKSSVGGSGRLFTTRMNAWFLTEIRDEIRGLREDYKKATKDLKEASKALKDAAKELAKLDKK